MKEKKPKQDCDCPLLIVYVGCMDMSYNERENAIGKAQHQVEKAYKDGSVKVIVLENRDTRATRVEFFNFNKKLSKMSKQELLKLAEKAK